MDSSIFPVLPILCKVLCFNNVWFFDVCLLFRHLYTIQCNRGSNRWWNNSSWNQTTLSNDVIVDRTFSVTRLLSSLEKKKKIKTPMSNTTIALNMNGIIWCVYYNFSKIIGSVWKKRETIEWIQRMELYRCNNILQTDRNDLNSSTDNNVTHLSHNNK